MMWGYGYEAAWWMLLMMVIYSVVGIIVVGALIWIVIWALTQWRQRRQEQDPKDGDADEHAHGIHAVASAARSSGADVATEDTGGQERSRAETDELTFSRR